MQGLKQEPTGWEAGIGVKIDSIVICIEFPVSFAQSAGIVRDIKKR